MSSACVCHIEGETCWWCYYQLKKQQVETLEKKVEQLEEYVGQLEEEKDSMVKSFYKILRIANKELND